MAELSLAYQARTYSSGTAGRSICNARNHHWVSEGPGGDAPGAGELFCASMAACAVNMVEGIARTESRRLDSMEVNVAVYTDKDKPPGDVSVYHAARVKFEMWGVSEYDAQYLVKIWKRR